MIIHDYENFISDTFNTRVHTHKVSHIIQARIKHTSLSFIQVLHFNNQININMYILSPNYIVNFVVAQPARKMTYIFMNIVQS